MPTKSPTTLLLPMQPLMQPMPALYNRRHVTRITNIATIKLILLFVFLAVHMPSCEGMRGTLYRSGRSAYPNVMAGMNHYRGAPVGAPLMFAVPGAFQNKDYQEFLRFGRSLYDVADNLQIRSQRGLSPQEQKTIDMDADDGQVLRFG